MFEKNAQPGGEMWRNCRYLVWGLGNTQWNAFMAFPRYVHKKLSDLGATSLDVAVMRLVSMPGSRSWK